MDSKNQFVVFCLCIGVGFAGGLLYELFVPLRFAFGCERGKNKALGIGLDITFFILFAAICIIGAYVFHFPSFRTYMWLGYGLGGIIYSKTLRRILAILEKVCYNMLIKAVNRSKSKKKLSEKGDGDI